MKGPSLLTPTTRPDTDPFADAPEADDLLRDALMRYARELHDGKKVKILLSNNQEIFLVQGASHEDAEVVDYEPKKAASPSPLPA